jgi:rod shape-determining protein MreD
MLTLIPWPGYFGAIKPFWFGLLAIYWMLEGGPRMSVGFAFAAGLVLDISQGLLFGEHAVRLAILVYITRLYRFRLRFFPIGQQSAAILALMLNDKVLSLWIRLLGGFGWPPVASWLAPIVSVFVWPLLFVVLDRLQRKN